MIDVLRFARCISKDLKEIVSNEKLFSHWIESRSRKEEISRPNSSQGKLIIRKNGRRKTLKD